MCLHYSADLQSVHAFRYYDNTHVCKPIALYAANAYSAEREMSASACTRSMPGYHWLLLELFVLKRRCDLERVLSIFSSC